MSLTLYPSAFIARLARLSSVVAIASLTAVVGPQLASAQSIPSLWEANYQPPSGIGAPRRVEGGASRGDDEALVTLTALVPVANQFGVTIAEHPTIFTYLPASANAETAGVVEFELVDANERVVYFTELEPSEVGGLTSIRLPETVAGLEVGRGYRWVVTVYDSGDEKSGETYGLIQRVEQPAQLAAALAGASAYEQALAYVDAGLWYDALTAMAAAYETDPSPEILASWSQLLRSAGLDSVARASSLSSRVSSQQPAVEM